MSGTIPGTQFLEDLSFGFMVQLHVRVCSCRRNDKCQGVPAWLRAPHVAWQEIQRAPKDFLKPETHKALDHETPKPLVSDFELTSFASDHCGRNLLHQKCRLNRHRTTQKPAISGAAAHFSVVAPSKTRRRSASLAPGLGQLAHERSTAWSLPACMQESSLVHCPLPW